MAKYDNLNWDQKHKVQELYEQAHPKPSEHAKVEEPRVPASMVIRANGENRVYVETTGESRYSRDEEVEARIVLIQGAENRKVDVSVDELQILIDELQRIKAAVEQVNAVRRTNAQNQKNHREALANWEKERDKSIQKRMSSGKITGQMIDDAESLKDLWL
jgi:hypothetical protein